MRSSTSRPLKHDFEGIQSRNQSTLLCASRKKQINIHQSVKDASSGDVGRVLVSWTGLAEGESRLFFRACGKEVPSQTSLALSEGRLHRVR